jgi:hypothetical protein
MVFASHSRASQKACISTLMRLVMWRPPAAAAAVGNSRSSGGSEARVLNLWGLSTAARCSKQSAFITRCIILAVDYSRLYFCSIMKLMLRLITTSALVWMSNDYPYDKTCAKQLSCSLMMLI